MCPTRVSELLSPSHEPRDGLANAPRARANDEGSHAYGPYLQGHNGQGDGRCSAALQTPENVKISTPRAKSSAAPGDGYFATPSPNSWGMAAEKDMENFLTEEEKNHLSSPARSQDGSSDPCGREHGIGLRGRDGGGTMNVSTARLSSLFEPSASTNPSSLTLKSSMSLPMTKSQSPSSLQTCSSSTRRRMARERRGAGSSLVSMETPY